MAIRNKTKYIALIVGCIILLIVIRKTTEEKIVDYKLNPDLPVLKENWKGNITINGIFKNDSLEEERSALNGLKWKLSKNPQQEEKESDTFKLETIFLNDISGQDDNIIWLGHSSFIININGNRIVTDPSLLGLPTSKRKATLPCPISDLTNIDYLLVSHNHYDHFDNESVKVLVQNNPEMTALLPLGVSSLFDSGILKTISTQEAGWFQEYKLSSEDIRIIFLPARHWSRRGLNDYNETLWGSFLIIADGHKIFFGGDTAYDNKMFKDIHSLFGDIDLCILPIGAYAPQSMMQSSHTTPEEAVTIFNELGGEMFIPMHYGTFDLSDEPLGEPLKRLQEKFFDQNGSESIKILKVGEIFTL